MLIYDTVAQPLRNTAREVIAAALTTGGVTHLDVAAAYVTIGGARDLLQTIRESLAERWPVVQKRWVIAFDYCRTEPIAADMLKHAPNSLVRIHDGARLVRQKCMPRVPFHPKTFIFRGPNRHAVLAGSGNVSRSGLNTGHEVGLLLDWRPPAAAHDAAGRATLASVQAWYDATWNAALPFTPALAAQYKRIYEDADNLSRPTPTEDDTAPDQRPGSLTAEDLLKLRACGHFWIEAGNITRNLGGARPGNQLMMKRLSRVFFGVPAMNVPQNSPLTRLEISYGGVPKSDCSLTFSDNGMDKLTLPAPGAGGPAAYDNETLLFTRLGPGVFRVDLGSRAQKREWLRKSEAVQASYAMPTHGRRWGVF